MSESTSSTTAPTLKRELGVLGAVMMGLGSIVGTGVFVSIGIGAGIAGPAVLVAIAVGAFVAVCNGLNSAQLAANYPVSGGTYEYAYRTLNPRLGFTAGWMFLCAKSASAATAGLGFAGYLINALGLDPGLRIPIALAAVIAITTIVLMGIRRSNAANIAIVSATLGTLTFFVVAGVPKLIEPPGAVARLTPFFAPVQEGSTPWAGLLEASALMFVAYTGYGRIATLGEEVREPKETIPRAIIVTLVVTMVLYGAVGLVGVGSVGAEMFATATLEKAAPLEVVARTFAVPGAGEIMALGAVTAMLGVLLNLVLGLSRVLLAMGRRRDMPAAVAQLNAEGTTPWVAVLIMGSVVAGLTLIGDVKTTWSFSAFTVLVYYALTNLSALQLSPEERRFPKWLGYAGLGACLFLAFWVKPIYWAFGLGLLGIGQVVFGVAQWRRSAP